MEGRYDVNMARRGWKARKIEFRLVRGVHYGAVGVGDTNGPCGRTFVDYRSRDGTKVCRATGVGNSKGIGGNNGGWGTYGNCSKTKTGIAINVRLDSSVGKAAENNRLPSPSVRRRGRATRGRACGSRIVRGGETTSTTRGDDIAAAHHAKRGRRVLMAFGFVEAGQRVVIPLRPQSVGPTIKHLPAFHGDVTRRRRSGGSRSNSGGSSGWRRGVSCSRDTGGIECTVETSIASSEPTHSFLVAELEFGLEEGKRPFGRWAKTKFFRCRCQQTCFLDHSKRESDYSDISKRDVSEGSYTLDIGNLCPEILDWIVKVPGDRERRSYCLKFLRS